MAQEIERKFLVGSDAFKSEAFEKTRITQGYLCSAPERSVRVRVAGERGFITIKGAGDAGAVSRFEWEKEIPLREAVDLLRLAEPGIIDKTRHLVRAGDHVFEVDEFHGDNAGLVVAEIELRAEDERFERPGWLGEEVTGRPRYFNVMLKDNPYTRW